MGASWVSRETRWGVPIATHGTPSRFRLLGIMRAMGPPPPVGDLVIERIASRACSLQGLPEFQYHLLDAKTRHGAESGVYNVLAALQSLGWKLVPPEDLPTLWVPPAD
jgi:hypothetical protein